MPKSIYQHWKPLGYTTDIICIGETVLKINILLATVYWLLLPDPGGQANFYGSHKIIVLIWSDCLSKGLSPLDV